MLRMRWFLILFVVLVTLVGCATTPPIPANLASVTQDPDAYRNQRIEVTVPVIDNPPPAGNTYRTWSFIMGSPETGSVMVYRSGYNPSAIDKAYKLVEEARQAGQPVTMTGKVRVGPYGALRSGMEIDLETVSYNGTEINARSGPYVGNYYYYSPYFYTGPTFFIVGHHHHHH